mmetsp:Transcript_72033/g.208625  ORF Transcript_72033/g.208625 Transcript_72033/m.208625 type:complete len:120 (+) Transcript_72033:357-716(+)
MPTSMSPALPPWAMPTMHCGGATRAMPLRSRAVADHELRRGIAVVLSRGVREAAPMWSAHMPSTMSCWAMPTMHCQIEPALLLRHRGGGQVVWPGVFQLRQAMRYALGLRRARVRAGLP